MASWVSTEEHPEFSLQNLPYGVFSTALDPIPRIGVAIGSHALDLKILAQKQVFASLEFDINVLQETTLNAYAALGGQVHHEVRRLLQEILKADTTSGAILRDNAELRNAALISLHDIHMHLPMQIGDYTDFFTSPYHAQNVCGIFF